MNDNSQWEIEVSLWDFIDNLNSDSIDFLTVDLNDREVIERIVQSVCVWDLSILDVNADVLQFQLIEIQKVMRQECEDSKELFEGIREREKKKVFLKRCMTMGENIIGGQDRKWNKMSYLTTEDIERIEKHVTEFETVSRFISAT